MSATAQGKRVQARDRIVDYIGRGEADGHMHFPTAV